MTKQYRRCRGVWSSIRSS